MNHTQKKILVIRHGALGDIINTTGAFAALRQHFASDHLVCLTTPGYQGFMEQMGYFDEVWCETRSKNPFVVSALIQKIASAQFDWVFDLQNSSRTSLYYQILKVMGAPLWSGIAPGCSHPQRHPDRLYLPASVRYADQLQVAGVDLKGKSELLPEISWMQGDVSGFGLSAPYVLLMPGSSLSGSYKRWPATSYAAFARDLVARGITPVLIAGPDDFEPAEILKEQVEGLLDLSLKTPFAQIASLARGALAVVGNDTGPTHIAAACGVPTLVVWSSNASDPDVYAPRGTNVRVVSVPELADLSVERVRDVFSEMAAQHA